MARNYYDRHELWDRDRYGRGDHGYGNRYDNEYRGDYRFRDYDDRRGAFERAGDEVRSWFGDDDAGRRRRMDERRDEWRDRYDYDRGSDYRHNYGRGGYDSDRVRADLDRDDGYRESFARRGSYHGQGENWRRDRDDDRDYDQSARYGGSHGYNQGYDRDEDRGFFDRAGDEVRSWFGDEDAERRRRMDARHDSREEYDRYYDRDNRRGW